MSEILVLAHYSFLSLVDLFPYSSWQQFQVLVLPEHLLWAGLLDLVSCWFLLQLMSLLFFTLSWWSYNLCILHLAEQPSKHFLFYYVKYTGWCICFMLVTLSPCRFCVQKLLMITFPSCLFLPPSLLPTYHCHLFLVFVQLL